MYISSLPGKPGAMAGFPHILYRICALFSFGHMLCCTRAPAALYVSMGKPGRVTLDGYFHIPAATEDRIRVMQFKIKMLFKNVKYDLWPSTTAVHCIEFRTVIVFLYAWPKDTLVFRRVNLPRGIIYRSVIGSQSVCGVKWFTKYLILGKGYPCLGGSIMFNGLGQIFLMVDYQPMEPVLVPVWLQIQVLWSGPINNILQYGCLISERSRLNSSVIVH